MTIEPPDDTPRSDFDALVEDTPQIQWRVRPWLLLGPAIFFVERSDEPIGRRSVLVDHDMSADVAVREAMAHCIADALTQAGF